MKTTTSLILFLIAVGLFYTFDMPEYGKIQGLRTSAASYNEILGKVSDVTQKRDELQLKYQAIPPEQLAGLERMLPDNVNIVELALNLDSIASKYGITIKEIKKVEQKDQNSTATVQTPSTGPYNKVDINFSFVAPYEGFRKFMDDLETSVRIIEVKSVSFEVGDQTNLSEYHIQIETYWLK